MVMVTASICQIPIDQELASGVNNMIGADVGVGHLIENIQAGNNFQSFSKYATQIDELADSFYEITFPPKGFRLPWAGMEVPSVTHRFYPHQRVKPLKFGTKTRIQSLTFNNYIKAASASVTATAMLAIRDGDTFQYRVATGTASAVVKKLYMSQSVTKCSTTFGRRHCTDEVITTERGLYQNEADAIVSKLQREAAISMKTRITQMTGYASPMALKNSVFLEESRKLRALFTEVQYDYSELLTVEKDQLDATIQAISLDKISDWWVKQRIVQVASTVYRSNFFVVTDPFFFFVVGVWNQGTHYTVKVTTFQVQGNRLPVNAFATSVGSWGLDRQGEGSNPSIHQLLAIFPPLKG
jgi:hypothetical protein